MSTKVVILSGARTPVGKFQGGLAPKKATELGAIALQAAVERSGVNGDAVDEVLMGCVLPAGLGQNPARQATIYGGLPNGVSAMTLNKVCGSGLRAVSLAAQIIKAGDAGVVVAGGPSTWQAEGVTTVQIPDHVIGPFDRKFDRSGQPCQLRRQGHAIDHADHRRDILAGRANQ